MTPAATTKRTLSTAEDRREEVLEAAMGQFAERGFLGTPTMAIAKAAGISQAYLFRLFPTKDDLVLAVVQRSCETIVRTLSGAAAKARAEGSDAKLAMAAAYSALVTDRRILLTQLHAQAAAPSMPAVAAEMRHCFSRLTDLLVESSGAEVDADAIRSFMAHGMLINVMTALGAADVDEPWAVMLDDCRDGS